MDYQEEKNSSAINFILLMVICAVLGVILAFALPNYRKQPSLKDKFDDCLSNQRVLKGAVEMYNMDVEKENMMHSLDQELLVKEGYLKKIINLGPEKSCKYLDEGDLASDTAYIYCDYHGDVEQKYKKSKVSF